MRLRRAAGHDEEIDDQNNGHNHEEAFVKIIEKKGTLDESLLLQESYAPGIKGKLMPTMAAIKGLLGSIPTAIRGIRTRQDALAAEADPGRPPRSCPATPRTTSSGSTTTPRSTARSSTSTSRARRTSSPSPTRRSSSQPEASTGPKETRPMKLAYWPGCVSRGFTTELHGSMALVAERLGIELVTLDRANCCGAGVIAEHNQELADTLNARTFALAQQTGLGDDEHLLDLPGRPVGVPAAPRRRLAPTAPTSTRRSPTRGSSTSRTRTASRTRTSSGSWSRTIGLDTAEGEGHAAALRPAGRPVLRLLRAPPQAPARLRGAPRARPLPRAGDRDARRRGGRVRRRPQVLRLPGDHDEPRDLAAPGRHPHRRRARRRAPTAW